MRAFFLVLVCLAAVAAFAPAGRAVRKSGLKMTTASHVQRTAAALLTGAMLTLGGNPVLAANYGGFGSTYAEVIDPKDSVLSETGLSEEAKAGLASLKTFIGSIQSAKADLAKDGNIELSSRLQSALNPAVVRTSLNKFNTAFTEDTQRGTDRLIRLVLQDLTELERETTVKAGKTRSEVKINNCLKRLSAAEDALSQLAAFAK